MDLEQSLVNLRASGQNGSLYSWEAADVKRLRCPAENKDSCAHRNGVECVHQCSRTGCTTDCKDTAVWRKLTFVNFSKRGTKTFVFVQKHLFLYLLALLNILSAYSYFISSGWVDIWESAMFDPDKQVQMCYHKCIFRMLWYTVIDASLMQKIWIRQPAFKVSRV